MRTIPSTPSLVPADRNVTVFIVLDDFGSMGTAYRETDAASCDQQSVVDDLLTGQFNNPLRVVASNTAEGWARDASQDIAQLVKHYLEKEGFHSNIAKTGLEALNLAASEHPDLERVTK